DPNPPPQVCLAVRHNEHAAGVLMLQGEVCICLDEGDVGHFMYGRKGGMCTSTCNGEPAGMCGGDTSYSLYKLVHNQP
ncbi:unnamed protein product, partial [Hapterophycus canaliculatus]